MAIREPPADRPVARPAPGGSGTTSVRILECDPELAVRVPAQQVPRARAALVTRVTALEPGMWEAPEELDARHLGFLLLEGVLARDVILAGTRCTELLGAGDILQPFAAGRDDALVRYRVLWHAIEPVTFAELDEHFHRSLGEWPQVMAVLLERALKQSLRTSIHAALLELSPAETRLLILFWFLAERWGRVTPGGVALTLRLSHRMLGQLVGCRRSSVTTALHRIEQSGLVARRADGTWLLRGSPPDELAHLRWSEHGAASGEAGVHMPAAG